MYKVDFFLMSRSQTQDFYFDKMNKNPTSSRDNSDRGRNDANVQSMYYFNYIYWVTQKLPQI